MKTVWYWANGVWCDSTPGEYIFLSKLHGCHTGTLDVPTAANHDVVQHMVDMAIEHREG